MRARIRSIGRGAVRHRRNVTASIRAPNVGRGPAGVIEIYALCGIIEIKGMLTSGDMAAT